MIELPTDPTLPEDEPIPGMPEPQPDPSLPDLEGFKKHFGIPVCTLGEDGDFMVALGHHDLKLTLAAFNAYAKLLGWQDLLDGDGKYDREAWKRLLDGVERTWAVLRTACARCRRRGDLTGRKDCRRCAKLREVHQGSWYMEWEKTAADPGAFRVMVLET